MWICLFISNYNPLINFWLIYLSILGHMVANRRSGIRQYTPFASIFAPRFFSSKKAWQSQQSESLFSLSSLTMSNGSSKDKLVLYNPVTLKFWACSNWQFRKMQKKKKEKRKKLWIEDEQNFTNYYTLAPLSQSLTQKWVEKENWKWSKHDVEAVK